MLVWENSLWVEGVPTAGLVDDGVIDLSRYLFVVKGTKRYRTALGSSRTIKHLVVINTQKADEILQKITHWRKYYPWKNVAGKVLFRAIFKSYKDQQAHFVDMQGKEHKLSLEKLAEADLAHLKKVTQRLSLLEQQTGRNVILSESDRLPKEKISLRRTRWNQA